MSTLIITTLRAAVCVAFGLLAVGCFESRTPLGPPHRGTIDKALVGSWHCVDPESPSQTATLWVIPFDEHQYYAEWRDGDDVTRYHAYSTRVGNLTLLNVQELTFRVSGQGWLFLRAIRGGGSSLKLSVVKEDSLNGLTGSAALREIKRRVADSALYGDFATCTLE
jgi:hypothetical protein